MVAGKAPSWTSGDPGFSSALSLTCYVSLNSSSLKIVTFLVYIGQHYPLLYCSRPQEAGASATIIHLTDWETEAHRRYENRPGLLGC